MIRTSRNEFLRALAMNYIWRGQRGAGRCENLERVIQKRDFFGMGFTGAAMSTEQGPVPEASRVAPQTRRFHLSDAMLLTAAVALGLATTQFMSGLPPYIDNP
jgi:hypothetical protein